MAQLSPNELVDYARDIAARHRADSHFPGAVDRLGEAAPYASAAEEACNRGGAAVAGTPRPSDVDAEEVTLYRPDRQAIGPRWSKLPAHPNVVGNGRGGIEHVVWRSRSYDQKRSR